MLTLHDPMQLHSSVNLYNDNDTAIQDYYVSATNSLIYVGCHQSCSYDTFTFNYHPFLSSQTSFSCAKDGHNIIVT